MRYIDIKTVVDSYIGFQDSMTNKSWGYLALLKGCKKCIQPLVPYEVNMDIVSNFLENIFNLSQVKREFHGGRSLYVVFSSKWDNYFKDQGDFSPNIYDVIAWAYRRETFPDEVTNEYLIKIFSEDFNIPISVITDSFDTKQRDILFTGSLYSESDLKDRLKQVGINVSTNNIDAKKNRVVASPGEISRGPFVQTLYAGLDITDYVLILQSDYSTLYGSGKLKRQESFDISINSLQRIFYGAPGTGKSNTIKEITQNEDVIRTTFHPDSDYSSFVGTYKPTTKEIPLRDVTGKVIIENGKAVTENRIVYEFVNQAFLQAYVSAWQKLGRGSLVEEKQYLVIEEINRGNCAQIFGDIFQLLNRDADGSSQYSIDADCDFAEWLKEESVLKDFWTEYESKVGDGKLKLPPNLNIFATMNTSDQSLFPMDSAFKRRFDWEYVPISFDGKDAANFQIDVDGSLYSWQKFVETVNEKILDLTESEDKQLGEFFIKPDSGDIISKGRFLGKVMFYLWNEVCKDEHKNGSFFRTKDGGYFTFQDLYKPEKKDVLNRFMAEIGEK